MEKIKILAVQDPAVSVYVDKNYDILKNFPEKNVEIEFDIVPWDNYFEKMINSFNGDADYDIVMVAGHLWRQGELAQGPGAGEHGSDAAGQHQQMVAPAHYGRRRHIALAVHRDLAG